METRKFKIKIDKETKNNEEWTKRQNELQIRYYVFI